MFATCFQVESNTRTVARLPDDVLLPNSAGDARQAVAGIDTGHRDVSFGRGARNAKSKSTGAWQGNVRSSIQDALHALIG